jgi:hypothetical protein
MLKLRKFLRGCFGLVALVYGVGVFETVRHSGRLFHVHAQPNSYSQTHWLATAGLLTLSLLIQLAPSVIAVFFAAAWFTLRFGRRSGRRWAIVASTSMLVVDAMLAIGLVIIWTYTRNRPHGIGEFLFSMMVVIWLPQAALGVAGLVAFWRDDAEMPSQVASRKPPRISGDGTSPLLDVLSFAIALGGFIGGLYYWERWGRSHHVLGYRHGFPLTLIIVGTLITTAVHESGHAAVGIAVGMKLRSFIVGPFQWRIRDGKWRFQFVLKGIFGGATGLVPTDPNQTRMRESLMIAAGPATELLFGLAALGLLLWARGTAYEPMWGLLAVIVTISILGFVGNLIPINPEGLYSDGARVYQLLKGGAWSDFHRATTLAASTTVTALRPRDYDIDVIKRAEQVFTRGQQAVLLRLLASSYYMDRGQLDEASQAVTDAETICRESEIDIPPEFRVALVFRIAFLRRDAECARSWWIPLESVKAIHKGSDYWLAKSALLLCERQMDEARNAWKNAHDLTRQLPAAGDYEFDRDRCELLRQAIDSTTAEAAHPALIMPA